MVDRALGERFDVVGLRRERLGPERRANKLKTWGGRLGYVGSRGRGASRRSAASEVDDMGVGFDRTVVDADLSYAPDGWVFGGEVNHGSVDPAGGGTADWLGFLAMAHRDFDDWVGLTVRYDYFDDQDGWSFGTVGGRQKRQRDHHRPDASSSTRASARCWSCASTRAIGTCSSTATDSRPTRRLRWPSR